MPGYSERSERSLVATLARWAHPLSRPAPWILNFHRVIGDDEETHGTTPFIRKGTFRRLLLDLQTSSHTVTLDELLHLHRRKEKLQRDHCAITFDDGWKNVYDNAFPVLRELQLPATVFLPVGLTGTSSVLWQDLLGSALDALRENEHDLDAYIRQVTGLPVWRFHRFLSRHSTLDALHRAVVLTVASFPPKEHRRSLAAIARAAESPALAPAKSRRFLDWAEVKEMGNAGIDFGSNGVNHNMLTKLTHQDAAREIVESKAELERILQIPVKFFAYPDGDFNPRVAHAVSGAGYEGAFVQRNRHVSFSDTPFDISRFEVREDLLTRDSGEFHPGSLRLRSPRPGIAIRNLKRATFAGNPAPYGPRPLRLALIIDYLAGPTAGGTETQLLELIKGLDRRRVQPHLIVLREPPSAETGHAGLSRSSLSAWLKDLARICPIKHLGCGFSLDLATIRGLMKLASFLTARRIQVIQTFFTDASLIGLSASLITRAKVIVSRRNCGYADTPGKLFFLSLLCRRASRVLANSTAAADAWRRSSFFSGPRIDVLRNGIRIEPIQEFCRQGRRSNRERLGLPLGPQIVGAIANLKPVKALDVFLDAARIVLDEHPNTLFVLVGSGPLEGKLRSQANRLGIQDNVVFAGSQPHVEGYLASFDIGVLPSLSEGLSNAIMEYMAAGLPVVATDVDGNKELVVHGTTGFLVPPKHPPALANSIGRLLADSDGRKRMGEASLARARSEFAMERMVRSHEAYYERRAWNHGPVSWETFS